MKVYNTLTRKKEELVPITPGEIKMYACGPTVYNYIHIGNARPLCIFDILRRYLEYRGYKVTFVQNFTDIDDKIIRRANEEHVDFSEISERYIKEFWTDADGLNVRHATVNPKATENIDAIIYIISTLIEKGYAYEAQGDVYFSTEKFKDYGKLSHQPLEDLEAGARIMVGEVKREPMDFAVWKAAKPGEPAWDSPWGKGRPGWHIECSAMNWRYLGDTIDIHCGGQDLIFPHHENEIAQSECFTGKPFAHYWMHNGYINVDNVKMSKSLGNFFTVRDVAEKYGYEPIRYLLISAQYRSPINYSTDIIEQCISALNRLYTCRDSLDFELKNASDAEHDGDRAIIDGFGKYREQFIDAMDDDLNTADAIASIFELVRDINTNVVGKTPSKALVEGAISVFDELTGVLGLVYNRKTETLDSDIEALIEARTNARKEKNWAEADRIRDQLKEMGIVLEDTAQGVKWHRGQDLIFPHHENEIAQSECFTGKPFAHYWMHNGYINVDNVKMSKSLGNFFTVRDVAEKYGYEPIRYLLISAQYRSPINYSTDIIEQCISALNRLYTCRDSLDFELKNASDAEHDGDRAIIDGFGKYREQFIDAMDDDLNTADAIASIFELVRDINTNVVGKTPSKALVEGAISVFDELTGVLGLVYNRKTETLDSDIEALIEARTNARKEKNWAEADRIRDQLKEMGIVLEDTAQGVKWHRE